MNAEKVNSVEKKITFAVGKIKQYMPIKLVFTSWSFSKGETHCSEVKYMEEDEDACS